MKKISNHSLLIEAFQYIQEGIWIVDSNLQTLCVNAAFERIVQQNEIKSFDHLLYNSENSEFLLFAKQSIQNNSEIELKIHLQNGRKIWVSIRSKQFDFEDVGKGIVWYFNNIDHERKTHAEQQLTLRNYTSLFEDSPVPIWEEDFSEVKKWVDELKQKKVKNIREYLEKKPENIDLFAGKIVVNKINHAVVKLNEGKSKTDVLSNIGNLRTPDFPEIIIKQVEAIFNNNTSCEFDVELKTLKGNIRHCWFKWTVVKGHEHDYSKVFLTTTDLTQRIIEENIRLQNANKEIELLIREVHHRVKNNFQIISSLIRLQINNSSSKKDSEELKQLSNRIHSMAAVHQLLYNSKKIDKIHFQDYLTHLVKLLIDTLNSTCKINTKISIKNIRLSLDQASTVGLVLNELITNSIKHGFVGRMNGLIEVNGFINQYNEFEINYTDDGIGIDPRKKSKNSLGMDLAFNLMEQIDGELIPIEQEKGIHYQLTFPQ